MPRKSAASREISKPAKGRGPSRLDAPYELSKEEAAVWRIMVDSKPADWFDPSHVPMMRSYCSFVVKLKDAQNELNDIKSGRKTVKDLKYIKGLKKDEIVYNDKMMKLSRAMRLTQSSVSHPRTMNNKLRNDKNAILDRMRNYRVEDGEDEYEDEDEGSSAFARA